ncbi:hypothetical protein Pcinc_029571 [Petrolisthes cinctipes]|uniref:Uncharacterized protein n=1 Tax=Petrolisthes cinctipes TaxID=88211 RepID=A0AAE1K3R9_PETCI|nr:hypothetical protein Pcinc_029571 [Petrolisthes cinctipes]
MKEGWEGKWKGRGRKKRMERGTWGEEEEGRGKERGDRGKEGSWEVFRWVGGMITPCPWTSSDTLALTAHCPVHHHRHQCTGSRL